jgi:hypothetical protein
MILVYRFIRSKPFHYPENLGIVPSNFSKYTGYFKLANNFTVSFSNVESRNRWTASTLELICIGSFLCCIALSAWKKIEFTTITQPSYGDQLTSVCPF